MKTNKKYAICMICLYSLIFQNFIKNYFHLFQYFDEFLAIIGLIVAIFCKKDKNDKRIIICIISIFILGIVSNIIYKYQGTSLIIMDMVLSFKFFFVYFLTKKLISYDFIKDNEQKIRVHIKIITILLFAITVLNYIFVFWPSELRFGIMSNKLFYDHPSVVASICVFLYAMLDLTKDRKNRKRNFIYDLLLYIMILSTLRYKAIGAAIIIVLISQYINKKQVAIKFNKLIPIAIVAFAIGWNQINYYYIELSDSARNQLTVKSIEIAKDYFPLGTGFGTYGSYVSGVNYSPVYKLYNMQYIQGLTPKDPSFISDTFWPMILGQFGLFGFIAYIYIIYRIYKNTQNDFDEKEIGFYVAKIISLLYLIILSTSDSSFVNSSAIPFAIILGINMKKDDKYEKN